jgi:hypothetical protein
MRHGEEANEMIDALYCIDTGTNMNVNGVIERGRDPWLQITTTAPKTTGH